MPLDARCPGCGAGAAISDRFAGRPLRCPGCGADFRAPGGLAAADARPAAGGWGDRVVAAGYFVVGGYLLVAGLVCCVLADRSSVEEGAVAAFALVVGGLLAGVGVGVWCRRMWGWVPAVVGSAVLALGFPVGTVLGLAALYALWAARGRYT